MGVSLSLERSRQARSRKRVGQHTRTTEEQACLDALAAFLRSDAAGAGRCLSRLSRVGLADRLLPAARALVRAAETILASEPAPFPRHEHGIVPSPSCLAGMCHGSAGRSPCVSPACQHDCHCEGRA